MEWEARIEFQGIEWEVHVWNWGVGLWSVSWQNICQIRLLKSWILICYTEVVCVAMKEIDGVRSGWWWKWGRVIFGGCVCKVFSFEGGTATAPWPWGGKGERRWQWHLLLLFLLLFIICDILRCCVNPERGFEFVNGLFLIIRGFRGLEASVLAFVSDIKYGGILIWSLDLLGSPAALSIAIRASIVASAKTD